MLTARKNGVKIFNLLLMIESVGSCKIVGNKTNSSNRLYGCFDVGENKLKPKDPYVILCC